MLSWTLSSFAPAVTEVASTLLDTQPTVHIPAAGTRTQDGQQHDWGHRFDLCACLYEVHGGLTQIRMLYVGLVYYDVTITIMASLKYRSTCRHKGTVKSLGASSLYVTCRFNNNEKWAVESLSGCILRTKLTVIALPTGTALWKHKRRKQSRHPHSILPSFFLTVSMLGQVPGF